MHFIYMSQTAAFIQHNPLKENTTTSVANCPSSPCQNVLSRHCWSSIAGQDLLPNNLYPHQPHRESTYHYMERVLLRTLGGLRFSTTGIRFSMSCMKPLWMLGNLDLHDQTVQWHRFKYAYRKIPNELKQLAQIVTYQK